MKRFFLTKIFQRIDLKNQKKFLSDSGGCVFGQPEGNHFLAKNSKIWHFLRKMRALSQGQKLLNKSNLGSKSDFDCRRWAIFGLSWDTNPRFLVKFLTLRGHISLTKIFVQLKKNFCADYFGMKNRLPKFEINQKGQKVVPPHLETVADGKNLLRLFGLNLNYGLSWFKKPCLFKF